MRCLSECANTCIVGLGTGLNISMGDIRNAGFYFVNSVSTPTVYESPGTIWKVLDNISNSLTRPENM
jgi:hypothetical protein